jgi:hypothetical protein
MNSLTFISNVFINHNKQQHLSRRIAGNHNKASGSSNLVHEHFGVKNNNKSQHPSRRIAGNHNKASGSSNLVHEHFGVKNNNKSQQFTTKPAVACT